MSFEAFITDDSVDGADRRNVRLITHLVFQQPRSKCHTMTLARSMPSNEGTVTVANVRLYCSKHFSYNEMAVVLSYNLDKNYISNLCSERRKVSKIRTVHVHVRVDV